MLSVNSNRYNSNTVELSQYECQRDLKNYPGVRIKRTSHNKLVTPDTSFIDAKTKGPFKRFQHSTSIRSTKVQTLR